MRVAAVVVAALIAAAIAGCGGKGDPPGLRAASVAPGTPPRITLEIIRGQLEDYGHATVTEDPLRADATATGSLKTSSCVTARPACRLPPGGRRGYVSVYEYRTPGDAHRAAGRFGRRREVRTEGRHVFVAVDRGSDRVPAGTLELVADIAFCSVENAQRCPPDGSSP